MTPTTASRRRTVIAAAVVGALLLAAVPGAAGATTPDPTATTTPAPVAATTSGPTAAGAVDTTAATPQGPAAPAPEPAAPDAATTPEPTAPSTRTATDGAVRDAGTTPEPTADPAAPAPVAPATTSDPAAATTPDQGADAAPTPDPAAPDASSEPEPVGPVESYLFNAQSAPALGAATSGEYLIGFNAVAQNFVGGRLYATPAGVHAVTGKMFAGFVAQGGHGRLGYPIAAASTAAGVRYQDFQLGTLFLTARGPVSVVYPMYGVFAASGGVEALGAPMGGEVIQGAKYVQRFEHTTLSVSRDAGQDSLGIRRGAEYFLKNEISPGEAHDVLVYGRPGDTVLVGDWDGDGVDTLAVRRGAEYHVKNSISGGPADQVIVYGRPGDTVLVGDWDGDGADSLAVRRGAEYHVKNSISGGPADKVIVYGRADDQAYPGDWFGTGADTIGVRRGTTFYFTRELVNGPADSVIVYGRPGDTVVVGDWDGDGSDSLAVRRGAEYHVNNSLRGGPADLVAVYGRADDVVLAGDWDGRRRAYSRKSGTPTDIVPTGSTAQMSRLTAAWANNSVNTTAFRKASIASFRGTQYTAYYDAHGTIVLARRARDGGEWEYEWTQYTAPVTDAHNSISLAVDGAGYLHVSWGQHLSRLAYARSVAPGSLTLGPSRSMVGSLEGSVTYPEFFRLSDGDLFFLYRHGSSGDGQVVLNRYDWRTARWTRVHNNLIDGNGRYASDGKSRSPYWQAVVDAKDRLHLSWVWRETPDVATNHDLAYARSVDSTGKAWEKSTGARYTGPITYDTAEYAERIPQRKRLMNQTSMTVDAENNPYITAYWQSGTATQYHVVRKVGADWQTIDTGLRRTSFPLSGGGTKSLPVARPQILVSGSGTSTTVHLVIRDAERGSKVSLASANPEGWVSARPEEVVAARPEDWQVTDLTENAVGEWEPSFDLDLWRERGILDVFVQNVTQVDGEGLEEFPPQYVYVLTPHLP